MRRFLPLVLLLSTSCAYCGHTSEGNELTGQVKKVLHNTPLVCPGTVTADISLGVIRNGVGSASKEDIWVQVNNPADVSLLETAAKSGALVNVKYDVARGVVCWIDHLATSVSLVADATVDGGSK